MFDGQANSMDALTAKGNVLAKLQETQAKSLSTLSDALENARKQNNEYLDAIEAQRATIADLEAQMERSGNSFDVFDKKTGEYLRTVSDAAEEIEAMRKELTQLESKQAQAAKSVDDWQIKVNKAQVELNSLNRQVQLNDQYLDEARNSADQCAVSIDNYGNSVKGAADNVDGAGENSSILSGVFQKLGVDGNAVSSALDKVGVSSGLTDALLGKIGITGGVVGAAFVAMGAKAVSAINQMIDSTTEVRNLLGMVRVNAAEAGIAFEDAEAILSSIYALSGDWGASKEASNSLLAITQNAEQLNTVVDNLSDAVIRFPDTLKIENLSESLQESVATGSATGQFAELIERLGLDIDEFNAELEASASATDRVNVAMSALAEGGLGDLSAAYAELNSANYELTKAQGEYEIASAKLAEVFVPAKTAIIEFKTAIVEAVAEDVSTPHYEELIVTMDAFGSATENAALATSESLSTISSKHRELYEQLVSEGQIESIEDTISVLKSSYEEAEKAALESIQSQMTIWSEYDTSTETTIGNIIGNLNKQTEWMNNYAKYLREAEIAGLSQELIEQLSNGTQESYEYLAAIHEASAEQIQELNNAYSVVQERQGTFAADLVEAKGQFDSEMAMLNSQLSGMVDSMDMSDRAFAAGVDTIQGYINGTSDKYDELIAQFSGLGEAAFAAFTQALQIQSPSKRMQWAAQMTFDPVISEADKAQLELAERSYNMGVSIINNYDAGTATGGSAGSMYNSVPSTGASAMPSLYESQQQPITIKFTGSLSQMARVMKPSFDQEDRRVGKRPIAGLR